MSEITEKAADVVADAGMQPILTGINSIADQLVRDRKAADEKFTKLAKDFDRKVEDLEAKANKSFEDVIQRVNKVRDASTVLGKVLAIAPGDDSINEVIPKGMKDNARAFEVAASQFPKDSPLSDAAVAMAAHAWFVRSTRIQKPGRYASSLSENVEQAEKIYSALQEKAFGANWEAISKAAYQEDTASEGGNLVPTIVESFVLRQIKDAGKLFPLARQVQMIKKTHDVPSESTAVTVNWVAEEGSLTQGEGNFGKKTLTALKIAGRAKMSVELVEDSNPGLLAYLLEVFSEKIAGELDKQMVLGDGSQPAITGIDNTSGINVISSSATAAGRNLTYALLTNTYVGAGESSTIENGYWIMSPKGYAITMGLSDSTGQPVIKFGTVEKAPAGTLFGRPIILSARFGGTPSGVTATLDDSTNANTRIIYGVPSSILFGTRQGLRWDVTDQVGWANFQMDARLVGRFGMIVGVPSNFNRITKLNT